MSLYLCVDCGGSKTSAVIADSNANVVGRGLGGPSNFAYLSLDAFIAAVSDAVTEALKPCLPSSAEVISLPLRTAPFTVAWFGVSGADSPAAISAITQALSPLLNIPIGSRLQVTNDTHLLAAPLLMHSDTSHAVAVIAGTGANAVSFRKSGDELEELGRYGGWGWILGDEGGGFSIGREMIRQLLHENDKASVRGVPPPESKLRTSILQFFGVAHVMELLTAIHFVNPIGATVTSDPPSYALMAREKRLSSLSPLVFAAAFEDSDPLALVVLRTMAEELASRIALLLAPDNDESQRAVKARETLLSFGGSLAGVDEYRQMILGQLECRGHVFKRVEYVNEAAVVGAVGLAIAFGRA
ncbi:hypothetical protein APHAL10511_004804 [Amanita phalloides]|nr:hypothetical protein APHAL10511_004804 [Amanita phalloides]